MPVNPDTVNAGDVLWDVLWDCHRHRMGNTTMSEMSCWQVVVLEVDPAHLDFKVSWNTNPPRMYTRRQIAKLRRAPATKKVSGRQWGERGPATCRVCGTTENLIKCLGCGAIRCAEHKGEDTCSKKKKRTS